jgi:transposase-like protein
MARNEDSQAAWLTRPLCRRYVVGVFEPATVRCRHGDAVRKLDVEWAFGWLSDGECEPLGAWIKPDPASDHEAALVADLEIRGVEWLWSAVGCGRESIAGAFMNRTPRALVERILVQAQHASERENQPSPKLVTERIRESLNRAIGRHGVFETESKALDLIAVVLQRAERRLDQERLAAMRARRLESSERMASLTA